MRRSYRQTEDVPSAGKTCYFYAPLTEDKTALIAWDGNKSVYNETSCMITDGALQLTAYGSGIVWNCAVPQNVNLTFSCWVKKVSDNGVNYNFGCGPKTTTTRYTGLNYNEYNYYLLMQEYLYFYRNPSYAYLTNKTDYTFITWTLTFNGGNSYTVKFYKNGQPNNTNTITNTSWKKYIDCYFEIGHFTNTMVAFNKHFSCFEELTDEEVLRLYNNGGIPY